MGIVGYANCYLVILPIILCVKPHFMHMNSIPRSDSLDHFIPCIYTAFSAQMQTTEKKCFHNVKSSMHCVIGLKNAFPNLKALCSLTAHMAESAESIELYSVDKLSGKGPMYTSSSD